MPNRRSSAWSQFNVLNMVAPTFGEVPEKTLYIGQRLEFPYASFFTQGSPAAELTVALAKNIAGEPIDITDLSGITSEISGPNVIVVITPKN